ncbi:MAG: zinc ribbon domain-containing protein [Treponema sp.]|jgi:predicted RNA-binding Zn-ribbon protein involved in translation (DUF1610 family)|nr:zinc ribbon domain-containing protein [Treponema sp.]
MGTKKPRFFCDNCGTEVDKTAKNCPVCGRFFASVRCPKCGFTGKEEEFAGGCPACGYSAASGSLGGGSGGKFETKPARGAFRGRRRARGQVFTLPFWLYLVAALALICALALLYNSLR